MSDVVIETDRLIIRDVTMPDGEAFIHMASDYLAQRCDG